MKDNKKEPQKGLSDAELVAKYGSLKAPFKKTITKIVNTKVSQTLGKAAR